MKLCGDYAIKSQIMRNHALQKFSVFIKNNGLEETWALIKK